MTRRNAVAWAAVILVAVSLLGACGGGDGGQDDARAKEVRGVAELATYAYAGSGPEGLYDYVAPEIAERCTKDQFSNDLSDQPQPRGFRGITQVRFEGGRAVAAMVLIYDDGDKKVDWSFVQTQDGSWRIASLPGLQECGG
jgi:hypothetical protein